MLKNWPILNVKTEELNFMENQLLGVGVAIWLEVEEPELTKDGEFKEDIVVVQLLAIEKMIQ